MTTAEARALLLALLPDGYDRWFDLRAPDPSKPGDTGSDAWRIVDGAAEQLALRVFTPAEQAALDANPTTMGTIGLAAWESALGLTASRIATQGTTTQRAAQVIARLREYGLPTLANIKAALAAVLGYVPTILEHDRATLTAARTVAFASLPATLTASATTSFTFTIADNAPCSKMGAQLTFKITANDLARMSLRITGPDATTNLWPTLGVGAAAAVTMTIGAPSFAGKQATGTWTVAFTESSGVAGTLGTLATAGLFVDGIGRDVLSGADGLGANVFEWAVLVDMGLVSAATFDLELARRIVARWNPAHARGYLARKNTGGGTFAIFDDSLTPLDGGIFDT